MKEWVVLNPPRPYYSDPNMNSVMLRLSYGDISFLLTGNRDRGGLKNISGNYPVSATVVQVGHHGIGVPDSPEAVRRIDPKLAVVSVGPYKSQGFQKNMGLLKSFGVEVLRTDRRGYIVIRTNGKSLEVERERRVPRVPLPIKSEIEISDARFDAPDNDWRNLNGEYVEVRNKGKHDVDLENWLLLHPPYAFPSGTTIESEESIKVHSGKGVNSAHHLYMGRTRPMWKNKKATAVLLQNRVGRTVDRYPLRKIEVENTNLVTENVESGKIGTMKILFKNPAGLPQSSTVTLQIENQTIDTKRVIIEARESKLVEIPISKRGEGIYQIKIGGYSTSFEVEGEPSVSFRIILIVVGLGVILPIVIVAYLAYGQEGEVSGGGF